MAGASIWWPTPTRPESHFSAEELSASDRYHRPLRRVALLGISAKVALLFVAAWIGSGLAKGDSLAAFDEQLGWFETVVAERVLVGAVLVVLAVRLPAVVSDAWFEFRFRRGIEGYRSLPVPWFLLTTVVLAIGSWFALVLIVGLGYRVVVANDNWPALLGLAIVGLAVVFAVGERRLRRLLPGGERPVPADDSPQGDDASQSDDPPQGDDASQSDDPSLADDPLVVRLSALAERMGVTEPVFALGAGSAGTRGVPAAVVGGTGDGVDGPNACAVGIGPNRRVVINETLLAEERDTVEFVVAHELTHLARRHLVVQTVLRVAFQLVAVAVVVVLVDYGVPWRWFGLRAVDPLGLPVLALVLLTVEGVIQPISGWASRAQERSADSGAIEAVGPLRLDAARSLYTSANADLDPPTWMRFFAEHPSPPERVEFLARHHRR